MHALFPCFSTVILIHKFLSLTGWITNYRFRHLAKTVTTKLTIAALCAVEKKDSFSQPMKLQEKLSDVVKVNEIRPLKNIFCRLRRARVDCIYCRENIPWHPYIMLYLMGLFNTLIPRFVQSGSNNCEWIKFVFLVLFHINVTRLINVNDYQYR